MSLTETTRGGRTPIIEPPLRAIYIREESDKVIVQASPTDIQRFTEQAKRGSEVHVVPQSRRRINLSGMTPEQITRLAGGAAYTTGDFNDDVPGVIEAPRLNGASYLYDRHGRQVCVVTLCEQYADRIDVTTFSSRSQQYVSGLMRMRLEVEVLPGVRVE